jgi:hypothetical protein
MSEPDEPPPVTLLNGLEPNQPIYRIFTQERFEQLLFQNSMALVRPKKWDDPLENMLLQRPIYSDKRAIPIDSMEKSYFGQCWTLKDESDAIWRIYAPDKNGVRVKTTVRKLANVLYANTIKHNMPQHSPHKCFIGKVRYGDFSDLFDLMGNRDKRQKFIMNDITGQNAAASLLIKRTAFSHEEEVRAIYNTVGEEGKNEYGDFILFSTPPDFIDEICFDPRMLNVFEAEKAKLINRGVTIPIVHSLLYAPLVYHMLRRYHRFVNNNKQSRAR